MKVTKEIELGGKVFSLETGRFAKQAHGAVMARFGDTMVLATVVAKEEPMPGMTTFPCRWSTREGGLRRQDPRRLLQTRSTPVGKEIPLGPDYRRPIRPMFPDWYQCRTQVIVTVYSSDQEHDGDVLGAVAASAALMISDIPFEGPIGEVRVGRINGELIINPTFTQLQTSDMDINGRRHR